MRLPRALTQVLDSDSKSVTFGWFIAIAATLMFYYGGEKLSADRWERMMLVASGLVAVKTIKEGVLDHAEIKADASKPAATGT